MLVSKIKKIEGGRVIVKDSRTKDSVLPNGATVISRKQVAPDKEIVLAKWSKGGREEFITWALYRGDDRSTSHGNYFSSLEDAKKDFNTRDSRTRDIETWTVKNRAGKTIAENISDIVEWLKIHSDVFEVARLNAIKTLIIA